MSLISSDTPTKKPVQHPDLDSATAAMIVGSVFVVFVAAGFFITSAYRRFPIPMVFLTIAAIIGGVVLIS